MAFFFHRHGFCLFLAALFYFFLLCSNFTLVHAITFTPNTVSVDETSGPRELFLVDVNGDGQIDVVATSFFDRRVVWFENSNGVFGSVRTIADASSANDRPRSVFGADFDGDGDTDILLTGSDSDTLRIYENTNGDGTAWAEHIIVSNIDFPFAAVGADINNDGLLDVVAAAFSNKTIFWYPNINNAYTFGPPIVLYNMSDGARNLFVADLDGDGDLDVVSCSVNTQTENFAGTDELVWHENVKIDLERLSP